MRGPTASHWFDRCFSSVAVLLNRCILYPAIHIAGYSGTHALLSGVRVRLAAQLRRGFHDGSGLSGSARRLIPLHSTDLLAAGGACTCRTACCSCRTGKARPTGNRACPGSVRPTAARRRCTAAMTSASGILSC